jgi:hypothetical protein
MQIERLGEWAVFDQCVSKLVNNRSEGHAGVDTLRDALRLSNVFAE